MLQKRKCIKQLLGIMATWVSGTRGIPWVTTETRVTARCIIQRVHMIYTCAGIWCSVHITFMVKLWIKPLYHYSMIPSLYNSLLKDGVEFSSSEPPKASTSASTSKDPNVVSSQQEEDDIAKGTIDFWSTNIATRMHSSIIEYSTATTTTPTLDICFIASRAAPAIAAAATTVSI